MNYRTTFSTWMVLSFALAAAVPAARAGVEAAPGKSIPMPSKQQYRWHEQERILFVHLAPNTWQGVEHAFIMPRPARVR